VQHQLHGGEGTWRVRSGSVRDQMFFGNDRLDFVIEAASAAT
jgi:hypothetical protein